jgi:hypothetical protein
VTPDRPDALILPAARKSGARMSERVRSVCDIAEPLLGVDFAAGERAWIRQQPHGRLFITRNIQDTMLFALDHPRSGQPRYRWVPQADGSEWGYLIPD